jgi:predicted transcriptional regulator
VSLSKSSNESPFRGRARVVELESYRKSVKGHDASKMRIMFTDYISYKLLNEYLNELLEKELLAYDFTHEPTILLLKEANS